METHAAGMLKRIVTGCRPMDVRIKARAEIEHMKAFKTKRKLAKAKILAFKHKDMTIY